MKAYRTLLKNELKMSLRGMDMVLFAVIMPIVILVILGIVFGQKPAFEGAEYTFLDQSFGALCSIAICAGGVMGLPLVISDYRAKHILKRYQVTPIKPSLVLIVEVSMYVVYSLASLVSLFIIAMCFFGFRMRGSIGLFLVGYLLVIVSMFSIGMMVGGIAKNSKIAGVIASALYFPMLVFSGATLPYEVMPEMMQKVVGILPLTQGIKILKNAALGLPMDNVTGPVIFMLVIAVICSVIGIKGFRWE
ncbi:MAG: ABC transporter permease [bacterium]|nr:ABC transporter permease [bacterium]